ncbi:WPP domain-associated protein-like [Vicia villosa]|uniref:WPP domain-associated protein-like n=1 Tax=Vicia villosa TaxID=3911 RepID=UPI00273BE4BF|nr:WPP domain-associated protein-like [Vicia villosa]
MDEIFDYMDGNFDVSLTDSTMMSIVHRAMNKAQEKMKTKTGVLERLNEISKFYELAVMQLEGCLTIVLAETDSSCLESNHEKLLDDLKEIKDRLQGRLDESELIISEKDRELSQRLKKNQTTSENKVKNDGDLGELRSSMDQQMLKFKQRLEPQLDMVENVVTQTHNVVVNDTKKIEEMGSDIDVLKQTMDLAFYKMQSALFSCEMRPKEMQWKLKIEKDMISILINSFLKEFQENIEVEARRNENHVHKYWQEHWSQMMNEVTSLKNELVAMHDSFPDEYDSSALSSPTKSSSEEGTHETFHKFPPKAEERDHKEGELQEEEENEKKSLVAKIIKNHEFIIRQKNEELIRIKHQKKASSSRKRKELSIMKEQIHIISERFDNLIKRNEKQGESLFNQKAIHHKETLPRKKLSSQDEIEFEKLIQENVHKCYLKEMMNEKQGESLFNKKAIHHKESLRRKKLLSQKDEIEFEKLIQENVHKCYLKEMMNELNEKFETNKIKRRIREDTNFLVFFEAIKDVKSNHEFVLAKENLEEEIEGTIKEDICMLVVKKAIEELNNMVTNCKVENIIREQIDQIVFEETLEVFVNISNSHHRKNIKIQENFSAMVLNQVQKFQGHENLTIILLESLLGCFEAEENLMLSAHSEIKEHSKQLDLGSERGDLHEYELFEDLITGEEQTFSSLTSKVENVLQQLGIGKALLKELGTSLGHRLRDSKSFHRQIFDNEQEQLKVSSFESTTFVEFEATVYQKLEMLTMRLEKMKCCVDSVIKMVACLRRNEILYQKAFISRCQNLQNAEAEVDLLGDQVEALVTLLEKIYATLHQHAPALKQHFEVFNILELIKTSLTNGAFQVASVAT